jgi:hypothetical protein
MDYEDVMEPPGEILEVFWHLVESPDDPKYLKAALAAPPDRVLRCIKLGYLVKAGAWRAPELTAAGRERLRAYRTCHDCRQECVEQVHRCSQQAMSGTRDEIEDVLATLTRDIERMKAGRGSWGPTPLQYAVALRDYFRRGYHHGEAERLEIESSSKRIAR